MLSRFRSFVFTPLAFTLPLIALGPAAVPSAHASTLPAATTGTTKAALSDGGVVWCSGSPGVAYAPTGFADDLNPDPTYNTLGTNPGNLPAGWQANGILQNPEAATATNTANTSDLGQDAETAVQSGVDADDVYAIQLNYWNSVVTGQKPGVPEYTSGTTTPGAIGYSTGNSCILYYPTPGTNGQIEGQFEITYPAAPSQANTAESQFGPGSSNYVAGAYSGNTALWNAFPLNGNAPYYDGGTDGGPTGYVSTWKGCSWDANSCTAGSQVVPSGGTAPIYSDWNVFPEVLSNITSIPTMWSIAFDSNYGNPGVLDYPVGTNTQHPVWDSSYDIWFDKTGQTGSGQAPYGDARGQNDGLEIMVWMNSMNSYVDVPGGPAENVTGYAQPSGWPREQVLINNVVYDVWTSRLNNPYYGYLASAEPATYKVVTGGSEPYTCPTLATYYLATSLSNTPVNGTNSTPSSCGTEWNVVSFVATKVKNGTTTTDYRGESMSMDTKVFTDYILGLNDGLWQQVSPSAFAGNRAGAITSGANATIGVLQCPASAMASQQANPPASTVACLSQSWLLTSIQAGFEPWEGGNGLESTSFQAHVITQAAAVQSGLTTNQGQTPGLSVVNWGVPFQVVYPGCQTGTAPITYAAPTAVSFLINGTNSQTGLAMTYPLNGIAQAMSPVPGTVAYEGEVGELYPMHSNTTTPTTITFTATCAGGPQTSSVTFWIDPSGQVFYNDGKTPVEGATVTLEYSPSDTAAGPYVAVPNENYGLTTDIMDTVDNTYNPVLTAQYGVYAWDVLPGYYEVTAEKAGCGSVTSPVQHVVTTPITNLFLNLPCAPPPTPAVVAASIPSAPATLTATAASSSQINLSWSASPLPPNATAVTYTVYEVTPTATVIASGITSTGYVVTGLSPNASYSFAVVASDSGGNSPESTAATTTTLQAPAGACHITYDVTATTQGVTNGLTVDINIQNTGKTAIYPWTLSWTFPGNQKITNSWNVTEAQSGEAVTMASTASWESIAAGTTLTGAVGFNGIYTGTNATPSAFYLNGLLCK